MTNIYSLPDPMNSEVGAEFINKFIRRIRTSLPLDEEGSRKDPVGYRMEEMSETNIRPSSSSQSYGVIWRKRSHQHLWLTLGLILIVLLCRSSASMIDGSDVEISNKKEFEDFDLNITPPPGIPASVGSGSLSSTAGAGKTGDQEVGGLGFIHAFVASLSVIVVSELGDKTFFIAAIMAMRHPRFTVFSGAIAALAFMTVLSALFGYATTVIPRWITYYISTALFAIFGLKMIYDGFKMSPDEGAEELEEVQAQLKHRDDDDIESQTAAKDSPGISSKLPTTARRILFSCFSRIFLQAFSMTFLAEWGDRSQIATVILAAREDVPGVCIGGILGHSLCTGLAVLGGRMIAQKISVRTVTIIGGFVFLLFAVTSIFLNDIS